MAGIQNRKEKLLSDIYIYHRIVNDLMFFNWAQIFEANRNQLPTCGVLAIVMLWVQLSGTHPAFGQRCCALAHGLKCSMSASESSKIMLGQHKIMTS
jgi:hypothetical protein